MIPDKSELRQREAHTPAVVMLLCLVDSAVTQYGVRGSRQGYLPGKFIIHCGGITQFLSSCVTIMSATYCGGLKRGILLYILACILFRNNYWAVNTAYEENQSHD